MRIGTRLALALGLTLGLAVLVVLLLTSRGLVQGFESLENDLAIADAKRVERGLQQKVGEVHQKSVDWSDWDDSVDFMKTRSPEFVASNIRQEAMQSLNLDAIVFLTKSDSLFYGMAKRSRDKEISVKALARNVATEGWLRKVEQYPTAGASGLLLVEGQPLVVSVRPIRKSDQSAATYGFLVFARKADSVWEGELTALVAQTVTLLNPAVNTDLTSRLLGNSHRPLVHPQSESDIATYTLASDINDKPVFIVKTNLNRSVVNHGRAVISAINYQLFSIVVLFSVVAAFVIHKFAIKRIRSLATQVAKVGTEEFRRVVLSGKDELADLALGVNQMLTRLDESAERMKHQAFHDLLTGLPNRALFMDRLQFALAKSCRSSALTAVLFVDLDNFKLINDSLGHASGDTLLHEVANRMCALVRPGDTVARLGGDEFTVLLEDLDSQDAAIEIAQRILQSLKDPVQIGNKEAFACASIGVAFSHPSAELLAEDLMKRADAAMYMAKSHGKSTFTVFDDHMDAGAGERLMLETALRKALDQREIEVHYQPLIDLSSGKIIGAEALARWQHPTMGMVSPGTFIPIAEETGLIMPIGYWILEEACRKAVEWKSDIEWDSFLISVNLSGKQLQCADVVQRVSDILSKTGLDAKYLKLEITESILMRDKQDVIEKLRQLKSLGLMLALDDFGTGYSSLSTLRDFPIDTLKIDRSFVSKLEVDSDSVAVVEAIIALARAMQMDVTAEGVETDQQVKLVLELGCQTGQGYFFARPLTGDSFAKHLNAAQLDARTAA